MPNKNAPGTVEQGNAKDVGMHKVVKLEPRPTSTRLNDREIERRTLALQILPQLPRDPIEAVAVLEAALVLLRMFYGLDGL